MKPRSLMIQTVWAVLLFVGPFGSAHEQGSFAIATFSADVTIPLNHRCMGVLPTKSKSIADPLEAKGFVLMGGEKPIVVMAIDWCEIRNGAYDQWREALAKAAGTDRERVLVTSLHQHDAPVTDADAAALLKAAGLEGELYDEDFQQTCIDRVTRDLQRSIQNAVPVTHIGTGRARVERIASNRRVVLEDGRIRYWRGSRSGSEDRFAKAPEGEIDSFVRTLSFWNGAEPIAALHAYAVHPMSYYGQGEVSADFVGLARRKLQAETPNVMQIYASGCSGDVTAGKYNDGSRPVREELISRLAAAMKAAWESTELVPLTQLMFRTAPLQLDFFKHQDLAPEKLRATLADKDRRTEDRILAAMGLASLQRVECGQPIDFPCVDFGSAKLVLFPGESFVGYQLLAQDLAPDSFVVSMGYGECWPGYIPLNRNFSEGFHDKWLWVPPGSEQKMTAVLKKVLNP